MLNGIHDVIIFLDDLDGDMFIDLFFDIVLSLIHILKLHICGDLNPVLELVARTGADIIDLDYMVDMEKAAGLFPKSSCICGNFNPVDVLYLGDAALVRREVLRCMDIGRLNPNMISPGCEIPRDASPENVLAIHQAIVEEN